MNFNYLYNSFADATRKLPYHTKAPYFIIILFLSAAYYFISLLRAKLLVKLLDDLRQLGRAEWAIGTYFVAGFLVVGALVHHKAHYHYFTILPIAFLAIACLNLIFTTWSKTALIASALALHLLYQLPYYAAWIDRTNPTSMVDASREMSGFISAENPAKMVPIIGEYSAQLALYGDTLMSLDAKWGSGKAMCERVAHWRPAYHVNVVWPDSSSRRERDYIAQCDVVSGYQEISRYPIFKPWHDEIVLSRLLYTEESSIK